MTEVRITLSQEVLDFPVFVVPIDIRNMDLALVHRGVSGEYFDLNEGSYFVTSILPDGRRLFAHAEVTGPETTIVLSVDPDYESDRLAATRHDDDIDSSYEIRLVRGNIISGELSYEAQGSMDPGSFYVEGTTSPAIIQVLKEGAPPLNILIPAYAYASETCEVLLQPVPDGQPEFKIRFDHAGRNLLFQYLANGYLREAATLARRNLLFAEYANLSESWRLLTLYTLLRAGELGDLSRTIDDSGHWSDSGLISADSSVIRGEILARLGRHQEAFAAFLELETRGVPVFTDGLFYATQRLKIYSDVLEMRSLKNEIDSYAILRRLQRIATYQLSGQPIVAYTGFDLTEPDAVPYFQRIGRETYDVLPLSIGLETFGGIFTKIFERNTRLPASKSETFSTASDNQTSVEVQVFQGERPMAVDNRSLGKFTLTGIPPMPRGVPQIEVVFNVDADGVLTVSAKDLATGQIQETTFSGVADLSRTEVNRLTLEAESFFESDRERLKVSEARSRIEPLIDQVKKTKHYEMGLAAIAFADMAIAEAEEAVKTEDLDAIENATHQLIRALYRLTEQATTAQGGRAEAFSGEVDAELDAEG